jgi:hypothetical protein
MREAGDTAPAPPAAPHRLLSRATVGRSAARGGVSWRPGLRAALVSAVLCLLAAAVAAGPAAAFQFRDDWRHLELTLTYLGENQPKRPLVLLFGGSAARECTISDRNWRRQIADLGGPRVLAFNLGAASESYRKNIAMVRKLPPVPTLIVVGVNVGRYTSAPPAPSVRTSRGATITLAQVDDYSQHRFHYPSRLTRAQKSAYVTRWLRDRYPVFRERFVYNAGQLRTLLDVCRERGFKVVLLNLPINLQVVRHRMDAPRKRYRRSCVAAAAAYDVPWVNFVARAGLVDADFADDWHLVEPGRVKWQRRLSKTVVVWLHRYGIGEPTPTPTPTPTATDSPTAIPTPTPT